MDNVKYGKYFFYLISVLFLIISLFGINRLITKADLPFNYTFLDTNLIASESYEEINKGDMILSVDEIKIKSIFQLETILDGKSIGQDTDLEIATPENSIFKLQVHLARYYWDLNFIIISFFAGLSFWVTSVFLIAKKYGGKIVTVLFWVMMMFSIATMTSPGNYFPGFDPVALIVRIFHVASYFLGAVLFFHFTFIFPRARSNNYHIFLYILYALSILFCITLITVQLLSISNNASGWVFIMENLWEITGTLLLIFVITGALNLFLYYRKISDIADKKKTEWIFWGLCAGAFPFLLLYLLPSLLGLKEIIPEEFLLAFLVLVPVFFAMAVVKYHVFEIEIFIKKSILYSAITIIVIVIYFFGITIIKYFAGDLMTENGDLVSICLILLAVFIFNPVQNWLKYFIDKNLYKENYNFEKAVSNFSAGIKDKNTISELSKFVIKEIEKIIPVKKIAFVASTEKGDRLRILAQNNFDDLKKYISAVRVNQINTDFNRIIAVKNKVEPGAEINEAMTDVLNRWKIDIVIPFVIESKNNIGAILLGEKLSGLRFMNTDIEILKVLISSLTLAYKKLQLQEKVVLEELEISRLEDFNDKMSYYVSSVSHDLKTPITSIKMFTEILKEHNNFKNENASEYLDIIEGESDRLSRLINNVLNYAKIENGIKEYSFVKMNLNECIDEVIKMMEYQFMMDKFKVEKCFKENIFIIADRDAVKEVLINLFTNAIKYSLNDKMLRILTESKNKYGVVRIEDAGIGMSKEDIENIFKPFVRLKNSKMKHTGGSGIGLSIVKNIMDAHKGRIEVVSTLGKGSSFILYFPAEFS